MASHVYFHVSDDKRAHPRVAFVGLVLLAWLSLSIAIIAGAHILVPGFLVLLFVVLLWRVARGTQPGVVRELQAIQLERLREHVPEAITRSRALLRRGLPDPLRASVLCVLGECAEMNGDFAEAADLFVRAEGALRATRMNAVARAQQLAIVAAHRAFVHAACGELDRAEAALTTAAVRDGVPLAGALSSRAALLVLARRGLKQQVIERLAADARLLRNALAFRDRALVAVIAAFARSRTVPPDAVDPAVATWVASAFPEARSVLGAPA